MAVSSQVGFIRWYALKSHEQMQSEVRSLRELPDANLNPIKEVRLLPTANLAFSQCTHSIRKS
jgi:hypothetical protein